MASKIVPCSSDTRINLFFQDQQSKQPSFCCSNFSLSLVTSLKNDLLRLKNKTTQTKVRNPSLAGLWYSRMLTKPPQPEMVWTSRKPDSSSRQSMIVPSGSSHPLGQPQQQLKIWKRYFSFTGMNTFVQVDLFPFSLHQQSNQEP